jgi:hypothetical protein
MKGMRAILVGLGVILALGASAFAQVETAVGCGLPRLDGTLEAPKVFIYEDGWIIPGLAGANVVVRAFDETGSEVIRYKPTEQVELPLQGFQILPDGHSLRFVPGYVQSVSDIIEYRVLGRTYAYNVYSASLRRAEPPMWRQVKKVASEHSNANSRIQLAPGGVVGCGFTVLRYFDTDGDGRFESLEYLGGFGTPHTNASSCPSTPEWALKLLPNRTAAESCAKELSERDLRKKETIRYLLDYQPALPMLQPKQ